MDIREGFKQLVMHNIKDIAGHIRENVVHVLKTVDEWKSHAQTLTLVLDGAARTTLSSMCTESELIQATGMGRIAMLEDLSRRSTDHADQQGALKSVHR